MTNFDWQLVKKISIKPFMWVWVFVFLAFALPKWWTGAFWWLDSWNFWLVFVAKVAVVFYVVQKLLAVTGVFRQTKVPLTAVGESILQGAVMGFGVGLIQFLLQMKSWTALIILTNTVNLAIAGLIAGYFWFYLVWWQKQRGVKEGEALK